MTAAELAMLLESSSLCAGTEAQLQDEIERTLQAEEVPYLREHRFSARDRVDFFVDGGIACEVKISGSVNEVTRQLSRYAEHDSVLSIVLVTSRLQLARVPRELNGKTVAVAALLGGL